MPRANRHFLPGHVWHITHRCHRQEFLLKFAKDRSNWVKWLFEAKKRYGLCVLNYIVTSNHIHLLIKDTRADVIPASMQLVASRTAQLYNQRKNRKGAFWEDRYHATAVENDEHLFQCLVYIDMNMVRAGVVWHPVEWPHSGYNEIQQPPKRYAIINTGVLMELGGFSQLDALQKAHQEWVATEIKRNNSQREALWSDSVAVGSEQYVNGVKETLGVRAAGRIGKAVEDTFVLKEADVPYNAHFIAEKAVLSD
jgi:REP element-mobilizing transposase RayT